MQLNISLPACLSPRIKIREPASQLFMGLWIKSMEIPPQTCLLWILNHRRSNGLDRIDFLSNFLQFDWDSIVLSAGYCIACYYKDFSTYRMIVRIPNSDGALKTRFPQVPVLPRVILAKKIQESGNIDVIVIVKVTEPPEMINKWIKEHLLE